MENQRIALVTGGTAGVGLSIVKALANDNWQVHFIGRNEKKGKEIESEVRGTGKGKAVFIKQDLSKVREVQQLARKLLTQLPSLNLLVNVAGVVLPKRQETEEGVEKTFAIGYLSAFIFSTTLAPLLAKSSPSRIANVGGSPSQILKTRLDFDDLNLTKKYSGIQAAFGTVHAKTVLTSILSEKYADKGIDVNSFHPGLVKSDLGRSFPFPISLVFKLGQPIMSKESKTGIYVCTAPELTGKSGFLFKKKKRIDLPFTPAYQQQLWDKTQEMLKKYLGE